MRKLQPKNKVESLNRSVFLITGLDLKIETQCYLCFLLLFLQVVVGVYREQREEKKLLGVVVVGLQRRKEGRNRDGWFVLVVVVRKRKRENRVVNGRRKIRI